MQLTRIVTTWLFLAVIAFSALAQPLKGDIKDITSANISNWFKAPVIEKSVIAPGFRRVLSNGKWVGSIFLTDQINPIPAYSGMPVSVLTAIDRSGRIVGVRILRHEEPILVIGIKSENLDQFTRQFVGLRASDPIRVGEEHAQNGVDGITGATITTMVITRSISTSAQTVFASMQIHEQQMQIHAQQQIREQQQIHEQQVLKNNSQEKRQAVATKLSAPPTATDTAGDEAVDPALIDSAASVDNNPNRWESWSSRKGAIAVMGTALTVLLATLLFQDWLVRRPVLFRRLRLAYLIFTVTVIGFYFGAQLSVINLFAFAKNISRGFSWDTLLIDPVIFLLWAFVAISLLLWGRGVFCGWLCPFGALQELIHKAARKFELPSFSLPALLHERLWALKYFMLIALLGVSLESFETMAALAEVEPFKTVALGFARPWYYVVYAVLLLAAAAFIGKFYCKYLCVLGAGLSILGRLHIFDWLHRRSQCGNPCQSCANLCPNGAIKETGEIISHECHYCMECQVAYWDKNFCQALLPRHNHRRTGKPPTETEAQILSIERKTQ